MEIKDIIQQYRKIIDWQDSDFVHQMICGEQGCEGILLPDYFTKVFLRCPICGWTQENIPEVVLHGNPKDWEDSFRKWLNK